MTSGQKKPPSPRKKMTYLKPRLRTIELVVEEVLSTGCKNSGIPGVGEGPCTFNNCMASGS